MASVLLHVWGAQSAGFPQLCAAMVVYVGEVLCSLLPQPALYPFVIPLLTHGPCCLHVVTR
jgi:hypothetical protein